MGALRAFEVRKGGALAGYLGEGGGPFLTAARSALPPPRLPSARFTSRDPHAELQISSALMNAPSFDAALAALAEAGFDLAPISHREAFSGGAR